MRRAAHRAAVAFAHCKVPGIALDVEHSLRRQLFCQVQGAAFEAVLSQLAAITALEEGARPAVRVLAEREPAGEHRQRVALGMCCAVCQQVFRAALAPAVVLRTAIIRSETSYCQTQCDLLRDAEIIRLLSVLTELSAMLCGHIGVVGATQLSG